MDKDLKEIYESLDRLNNSLLKKYAISCPIKKIKLNKAVYEEFMYDIISENRISPMPSFFHQKILGINIEPDLE